MIDYLICAIVIIIGIVLGEVMFDIEISKLDVRKKMSLSFVLGAVITFSIFTILEYLT